MRRRHACLAALAAIALATPALAQAPGVRIVQAAARVAVIPEARRDVAVSVQPGAARLPPIRIRREGATVVADGGLAPGFIERLRGRKVAADCGMAGGKPAVQAGGGRWRLDQLPLVTVRVPLDARVEASGALYGAVGPASQLTFSDQGCGDWTLGRATPNVEVRHGGDGVIHVEQAPASLYAETTGRGSVVIAPGFTAVANLLVKGPGRIDHRGSVGRLTGEVDGSGLVTVVEVAGTAEKTINGTGDVRYGRPAGQHYVKQGE